MKLKTVSVLFLLTVSLQFSSNSNDASAFQQRRPRFGNGALLRRIFGNDDEKEKEKSAKRKKDSRSFLQDREDEFRKKLEEARREFDQKMKRLQRKVADKFSLDTKDLQRRNDRELDGPAPGALDGPRPFGTPTPAGLPDKRSPLNNGRPTGSNSISFRKPNPSDGRNPGQAQSVLGRPNSRDDRFGNPNPLQRQPKRLAQADDAGIPRLHVPGANGLAPSGPPSNHSKLFGITIDPKNRKKGLLVAKVDSGSPAAKVGLRRGDLIVNVAGMPPGSTEDIDSLLRLLEADNQFEMEYISGGRKQKKFVSGLQRKSSGGTNSVLEKNDRGLNWPPSQSVSVRPQSGISPPSGFQNRNGRTGSTIDQLRNELARKNERIRWLEGQLESIKRRQKNRRQQPSSVNSSIFSKRSGGDELELELESPNGK